MPSLTAFAAEPNDETESADTQQLDTQDPQDPASDQPQDISDDPPAQDPQDEVPLSEEPTAQPAAQALPASNEPAADEEEPFDLASAWNEGAVILEETGTYELIADVRATEPLQVHAPADQTIVIDLAGHSAKVAGDATTAIDVSGSLGTVIITDSTFTVAQSDDSEQAAWGIPQFNGTITLEASNPTSRPAVITATWSEDAKNTHPELVVENIALTLSYNPATFGNDELALGGACLRAGLAWRGEDVDGDGLFDQQANVTVKNCSLRIDVSEGFDSERIAKLAGEGFSFGRFAGIDTVLQGITLEGFLQADFQQVSGISAALSSTSVDAFIIGPTLAVPTNRADGTLRPLAMTLEGDGYPADKAEDSLAETVLVAHARQAPLPFSADEPALASGVEDYELAVDSAAGTVSLKHQQELAANNNAAQQTATSATTVQAAAATLEPNMNPELLAAMGALAPTTTTQLTVPAGFVELAPQDEGIDLNEAWIAADEAADASDATAGESTGSETNNVIDHNFQLTEGGTYYLSDDLTVSAALMVNASGQDVIIDLRGHTLKLAYDEEFSTTVSNFIQVNAANSLRIESSISGGTICSDAYKTKNIIYFAGTELQLDGIAMSLTENSVALASVDHHAISIQKGTLVAENVTAEVDLSKCAALLATSKEAPAAIFLASNTSATLTNVRASMTGTPVISTEALDKPVAQGNAYALYSNSNNQVTIDGGTYTAISARGNATALCGRNLLLAGDGVTVRAGAAYLAAGVMSTVAGGVTLNALLTFQEVEGYSARYHAALRSQVARGFVFGLSGVTGWSEGTDYSALVGTSISAANGSGTYVGTFGADADSSVTPLWAQLVTNALGQDAPCRIVRDETGLYFSFAEENAVAELISGDTVTAYESVTAALRAAKNGDTIRLLQDVDALDLAKSGTATNVYTIDLNGHTAGPVVDKVQATVCIRNGRIEGTSATHNAAVEVTSNNPTRGTSARLILQDVEVTAVSPDASVYGIYVIDGGTLELDGVTVSVDAERTSQASVTATALYLENGGTAMVDNSSLEATTYSLGAMVYGIDARGSGATLTVTDSSVSATGSTADTGAIWAGGTCKVENSQIETRTTGTSSSAYGIRQNSSSAGVTVEGCAISVTSFQEAASDSYWCLLGSVNQGSSFDDSWTLAGTCSFESSTGHHLGYNTGIVALGEDFALADTMTDALQVWQRTTTGNLAFTALNGGDISGKAELFAPIADSPYEGWSLVPGGTTNLVWSREGVAALVRDNATVATYSNLADALAACQAGDTVQMLADCKETTSQYLDTEATLDLNGHVLTLAAGVSAAAGFDGAGAALVIGPESQLVITDTAHEGKLLIEVGSPSEALSALYQGIYTAGSLTIDGVEVTVAYTGQTQSSVTVPEPTVQGVHVADGTISLENGAALKVLGCAEEGSFGALSVEGIHVSAADAAAASVSVDATSQVIVENGTAAVEKGVVRFAETVTEPGEYALLPIYPTEESDPAFYAALQSQFARSAKYDTADTSDDDYRWGAGIYYTSGAMVLKEEGAWYDGLYVYAYSDVVPVDQLGTADAVTATHFFIQTPYEDTTSASGVVVDAGAAGSITGTLAGTVQASAPAGDATALAAGSSSWTCNGATLQATGSDAMHVAMNGYLDLRDYITFDPAQENRIYYNSGNAGRNHLEASYEAPVIRGVTADDTATLVFDGATTIQASGFGAADIDASLFQLGSGFTAQSTPITVANPQGANTLGAVFTTSQGTAPDPSQFADAYGTFEVAATSENSLMWGDAVSATVSFYVEDACAASFGGVSQIDLTQVNALASRKGNAAMGYAFIGWATAPDSATATIPASQEALTVTESATYYAVYDRSTAGGIQLSITNLHDEEGNALEDLVLTGSYGQTLGEILAEAGAELPSCPDFTTAAGTTYHFVGWSPSDVPTTTPYSPETVADAFALDASVAGVTSGAAILSATYVPVEPGQHVITFLVDNVASVSLVDDGERPSYAAAAGTTSESPAKSTVDGVAYTFEKWIDGDGETYTTLLPYATQDQTYIASFTTKASDVTLNFWYYHEVQGVWSRSRVTKNAKYDAHIQSIADSYAAVGSTVRHGDYDYTLLGWSPRSTDKDPVYTADNPIYDKEFEDAFGSNGTTFYGVYQIDAVTVDVIFQANGQTYATASGLGSNDTIGQAFAATGADTPASYEEDGTTWYFVGWALDADATTALGTLTLLSTLVDENDRVTLHALYVNDKSYTISFRKADRTLITTVTVPAGQTVVSTGTSVVAPKAAGGTYFAGWKDGMGNWFLPDSTPVSSMLDVYATYGTITADASEAPRVTVDTSATSYTDTSVKGGSVESASVSIKAVSTIDSSVKNTLNVNGFSVINAYEFDFGINGTDGSRTLVNDGFGTVTLTLYVGDQYADAQVGVFWLDADGAVRNSANKSAEIVNGYITFTLSSYGKVEGEPGNLVVAFKSNAPVAGDSLSGLSPTTLGSGSSLKSLTSLGGLSDMSQAGGTLASAGADLSANPGDAMSALSSDSDGAGITGDDLLSSGNGAASLFTGDWNSLLFLLLGLLLVAFIGWRIWLFILGRRDKDEDEEELPAIPSDMTIRF